MAKPIKESKTRRKYAKALDGETTAKRVKMDVALLTAEETKEAKRDSGHNPSSSYIEQLRQEGVGSSAAALIKQRQQIAAIQGMLEEFISRPAETPLKPSDKIAAARLHAEIAGILGKQINQQVTIHAGVVDLRQASESELLRELAELEEKKRSAIDVTPEE